MRAAFENVQATLARLDAEPFSFAHPLDPDEVQFQIAACAEIGGHLEAAISAYEKLRATDPRSKLVLFATAHLGILYALKGRLGRAATCLEEYAARYAGERNAKDALDSRFADSE